MKNNNEQSHWVEDPSALEKAKLPSGRSIKSVKKDAKKFKKLNGVTHHAALDIEAEKNGLGCLWSDFVLRAKELLGTTRAKDKTQNKQPYSKNTLILGDTGTGRDRIALQQLMINQDNDQWINDWVIDVRADNTLYWLLSSIAKNAKEEKALKILNHVDYNANKNSHFFNFSELEDNHFTMIVNALIIDETDRGLVKGILSQINCSQPFHELCIRLDGLPVSLLQEHRKKSILSIMQRALELGIFDKVATRSDKAWLPNDVFSGNSMNLIMLPALEKDPDVISFLFGFYLRLLHEKMKQEPIKRFRITLFGLTGNENYLPEFINDIMASSNIEIILSSEYPSKDNSAYDNWLQEFETSICLRSSSGVPKHIQCFEEEVCYLKLGDAIMLNDGKVIPVAASMPIIELPELDSIKLFHANGQGLSE